MGRWEIFKATMVLNWRFIRLLFSRVEANEELKFDIFGNQRSSEWPALRKAHLLKEPDCQLCGTTDAVEVHHVFPIWLRPDLELCAENLQTLCRPHHFLCGHLCSWACANLNSREDAAKWRAKIRRREQLGLETYYEDTNYG